MPPQQGSVWGFVGYTAHLEGDLALAERLFTRALAVPRPSARAGTSTWPLPRQQPRRGRGGDGSFTPRGSASPFSSTSVAPAGCARLVFEPLAALAVIAAETDDPEGAANIAGAAAATRLEPPNAIDDRLEARLQAAKQAPGWDATDSRPTPRLASPDAPSNWGSAAAQPQEGRVLPTR